MKDSFNLIVTHEPTYTNYKWTLEQLRDIIGRFNIIDISQSRILLKVEDPYKAIDLIRDRLPQNTPILRVIPVDLILKPFVEEVAEAAWDLSSRIPVDATFRVTLEGGHLYWRSTNSMAHTIDAIKYIASKIDRKVKLRGYDWEVYIRVLRLHKHVEVATLTVAPAKYIFSKAKR